MIYKLTALINIGEDTVMDIEGELNGEVITYHKKKGYLNTRFNNNLRDFNREFTHLVNSLHYIASERNLKSLYELIPCK